MESLLAWSSARRQAGLTWRNIIDVAPDKGSLPQAALVLGRA